MDFSYSAYSDNIIVVGAHWQGKTFFTAHALVKPISKIANIWCWAYNSTLVKYLNPPTHQIKHRIEDLEFGTQFIIPKDKSYNYFEKFLEKALSHKNLVVVIDEAHNYSSPHRIIGNHAELIRNAGNQGISYIEIFQRPQRVNGDVLENARHRFCFALDNLSSVKYMREWIGIEAELFLSPFNRSPQARKILIDSQGKELDMLSEHSFIYRDKQKLKPEVVEGGLKI